MSEYLNMKVEKPFKYYATHTELLGPQIWTTNWSIRGSFSHKVCKKGYVQIIMTIVDIIFAMFSLLCFNYTIVSLNFAALALPMVFKLPFQVAATMILPEQIFKANLWSYSLNLMNNWLKVSACVYPKFI